MQQPETLSAPNPRFGRSAAARWRSRISLAVTVVAIVLLAATYFLISPPPGEEYPGAIAWSENSLLKPITDGMSLFGAVRTIRGVEIKDLSLHIAAALGLVLLALRALVSALWPADRRTGKGAWFVGQAFLAGWVLISAISSLWSGDVALTLGQATLYAMMIGWAVSLSWTLEGRDAPRVLIGYVVIAVLGAVLCIWYFHERNPYHRPGFPIGNPGTLAGVTLPATLLMLTMLVGGLWERFAKRRDWPAWMLVGAAAALVPLVWCMGLTFSRGALIGGVLGLAGMVFLVVSARVRRIMLVLFLGGVLVGAWMMSSAMQEVAMARGATLRFRLYAWRYAAELWSQRSISGIGAGNFPRLANAQSIRDQALDPAAFLGDLVEHAHCELFEVFAEIGLLGGVTFVAGYVATLAAAAGLLRVNQSPRRRWLVVGLVAGVIAVLGDELASVGFRLPGVPAVFFTLLGVLWAMSRAASRSRSAPADASWGRGASTRRFALCGLSAVFAAVLGTLTWMNWTGVRDEMASEIAYREGRYDDSRQFTDAAAVRLLDPVRRILAQERGVRCENGRAAAAFYQVQEARNQPVAPSGDDRRALESAAFQTAAKAYRDATEFERWAPTVGRAPAMAAEAAEMAAILLRPTDPQSSVQWQTLAWQAWQVQRREKPYDATALWALTRYPLAPGEGLALLREALRNGFVNPRWTDFLRSAGDRPDLESVLDAMVEAVRPYTPETDLDNLVLSFAPETYRLRALWLYIRNRPADAAEDAARAVELYRPMHSRFPELLSVSLCERAEYVFRVDPRNLADAVVLAREALAALPVIQEQQYDTSAEPFRQALITYLLADDRTTDADEVLADLSGGDPQVAQDEAIRAYRQIISSFLHDPPETRPNVELWIERLLARRPADVMGWAWRAWLTASQSPAEVEGVLKSAGEAGVGADDLESIRRGLAAEFPTSAPASAPSP